VQFEASEEYVELVEKAKALLSHAAPRADLSAELQSRKVHGEMQRGLLRTVRTRGNELGWPAVEGLDEVGPGDADA
jgi:hypothetical protein